MELIDVISVGGMVVSIVAAGFAWYQVHVANKTLRQSYLLKLFSTFDAASQHSIENPKLLYSVHGLDPNTVNENEAMSIAYLSLLMDGFQHFYGQEYNNDYERMVSVMKNKSTFLNKILSVPENKERWRMIKSMYYGKFDKDFTYAIDLLIEHEEGCVA